MFFSRVMHAVLDALLPQSAWERALAKATAETLAKKMNMREHGGALILFDYRDPLIKHLIWSLKYRKSMHAAELSAEVLADVLLEDIAERNVFSPKPVLLIPIPLAPKRQWARGYNQMDLVLEKLAPKLESVQYVPGLLQRARETLPQTELSKGDRLQNVQGAFATPNPKLLEGHVVYLFDDVTTTGATLGEARLVLENAGATVVSIALAH